MTETSYLTDMNVDLEFFLPLLKVCNSSTKYWYRYSWREYWGSSSEESQAGWLLWRLWASVPAHTWRVSGPCRERRGTRYGTQEDGGWPRQDALGAISSHIKGCKFCRLSLTSLLELPSAEDMKCHEESCKYWCCRRQPNSPTPLLPTVLALSN